MRTRIIAAAVAAAALLPVTLLAATPASAATKHDVLTYGKVGGTNVKVKDVLSASLAKKAFATFTSGSGTSATTLKCAKSSFTAKVVTNPTAGKATAKEALTAQTASSCTVTGPDASLIIAKKISISLLKPPYSTTVSDKKGDPVVVSKGTVKVVVPTTVAGTLTCLYTATTVTGNVSNKHETVTFTKQTLTETTGSSTDCALLPSAKFSAVYGPVVDNSVKGKKKPVVFVN
jgi:hypothetical protein